MKIRITTLVLVFFSFYFVLDPLRDILETGDFAKALYWTSSWSSFLLFLSNLLVFAAFYFGAFYVFYSTYGKLKSYWSFSLLPLLVLGVIGSRYFLQEILGNWLFGKGNYTTGISLGYYIMDNLYYAIIYVSLGTVVFFIKYAQHKEIQEQELMVQHQKTELTFLRSQINPHFLFNILNNIYALIYYKSDNALKSVEKLSALLRYSLYEKAERVSLNKEIKHIEYFIDLQKMRLDYEVALNIQIDAPLHLKIAPLLLIPFVENAFKHGNLKNPLQAAQIKLQQDDNNLIFWVENEKKKQEKDQIGGIGVQNVRKRLQLLYGDAASLHIQDTDTTFKIQLKIALSAC